MARQRLVYHRATYLWQGYSLVCLFTRGGEVIHSSFSRQRQGEAVERLTSLLGPVTLTSRAMPIHLATAFADYFAGHGPLRVISTYSPLFKGGTEFQQEVWRGLLDIPYGTTRTYGELALDLKRPGAARAVGQACNANPLALIVPCHRVVAGRTIGGFAGGKRLKKRLLQLENS